MCRASARGERTRLSASERWTGRRLVPILCAVLCALAPLSASAATPPCVVENEAIPLDDIRPTVMDTVHLRYSLTYDESCQVSVVMQKLENVVCAKPETLIKQAGMMSRLVLQVDVDCQYRSPGVFFIPPVSYAVTEPGRQDAVTVIPPFAQVSIQPSLSDRPLEDSLQFFPWMQSKGLMWLMFLVLAGIMLVITVIIYRRSTPNPMQDTLRQAPNPIEVLLADIAVLLDTIPSNLAEYKLYHDRLSSSFRLFLSQTFGVDAFSYTTNQLCQVLQDLGLEAGLCEEIRRILSESDLVKFAQDEPSQAATMLLLRDMGYLSNRLTEAATVMASRLARELDEVPEGDTANAGAVLMQDRIPR